MLREGFFHRFGELVRGGAGRLQLDEEGEHLLAERILNQRRLVGPFLPEGLAEAVGFSFDAALAAARRLWDGTLRPLLRAGPVP
ncbi:hypothetical protein ACH4MG_34420 [Streptomyces sp. NPDC017454]|uniref:hypothetical protein n=1 Tax=Streptomyces sp. NPDC017454 TaxID=3364997 RepID=UPI0037A27E04